MILVIFLAALIGSILIGLPICFALLFSGVCMMIGLNGFNSMILSMNRCRLFFDDGSALLCAGR